MMSRRCTHNDTRWHRDGGVVERICLACKTVLATDTIAFSVRPVLANQLDPDEERAWRGEAPGANGG